MSHYKTGSSSSFSLVYGCSSAHLPQVSRASLLQTAARSQRTSSLQASLSAIAMSPSSGSGVNYLGKMEECGKRPEALC